MDQLIATITDNVGIDQELAEKAVAIILNFLSKDGPQDLVGQVIAAMPGATEFLEANQSDGDGGLLGGLVGSMGAMGALNEMTSAGLNMGQVSGVTREVIAFAKQHADEAVVDEIVGSIPGLSQVI
ncbi:MAG: DUF2267 domain-containing protein [Pseudomonadota bacterium]